MNLFTKSILFARRLSILYLFLGIFSIFFGIFYYRYIPGNQAELNSRGFRILNQLANNMTARNANLADAFSNIANCHCMPSEQKRLDQQIDEYIHFHTDTSGRRHQRRQDSLHLRRQDSLPDGPQLQFPPTEPPRLSYGIDSTDRAIIKIADFLEPVLAARDDLFDTYVVLHKDSSRQDSAHQLRVVYLKDKISASFAINVDSALSLQKNTDLSTTSTILIGGESYLLFYQPFQLAGSTLVLGGLISKAEYDRQVKSLPTSFVVGMILVILLGLTILPFLKVFFLSPRERLRKWDLLSLVLAIYLGCAVCILAGDYFLADFSAESLVESRLHKISIQLDNDIRQDLRLAGRQLESYIAAYRRLDGPLHLQKVLSYKDTDHIKKDAVDRLFTPTIYPLVTRVAWFDSTGMTMAKWNPYTFISPFSPVKDYSFFRQLCQKDPDDTSLVLTAGKSNITSEFQLYLARRLQEEIDTAADTNINALPLRSFGIVVAFNLHSGLHPVLPRGYGFCLVDTRTKGILMHSDARRNLSENLYAETDNNERVKYAIDLRAGAFVDDVRLYGSAYTFYVHPLAGQEVTLVVFYDKSSHFGNIFRMIHFGGESLLYLFLLFCLCLLLSTALANRPSKLSFEINPVEWVRPVHQNQPSYDFTQWYFRGLLAVGLVYSLLLPVFGLDIRIAFYISLLLPFYALWGFLASRRKVVPLFTPDDPVFTEWQCSSNWLPQRMRPNRNWGLRHWSVQLISCSPAVVITIVLLNWLIFRLIARPDWDHGRSVAMMVIFFQGLALALMVYRYWQVFISKRYLPGEAPGRSFSRLYVCSAYYSLLVLIVLPVLGILWYAWTVEKSQFIRSDELYIAGRNTVHQKSIARDIRINLKKTVLGQLEQKADFTNRLLYDSRYLDGETITGIPDGWRTMLAAPSVHDPDQPYIILLDELFLVTAGEYKSYSIDQRAADSTWIFKAPSSNNICLLQKVQRDSATGLGFTADSLLRDFQVCSPRNKSLFSFRDLGLFHWSLLLLAIVLFLMGIPRLIALTANRIFLLDFLRLPIPAGDNILDDFFPNGVFPVPNFLHGPSGQRLPVPDQEEHILHTMLDHQSTFKSIWKKLSGEERYFLFDFAGDRYTNYRDAGLLLRLLRKGILKYQNNECMLFAISFREFILQKRGSPAIKGLKEKYAVPGVWATIRIPALIIIAACAVMLVMTQESISHRITVALTSVGAIIPVVLELTKKFGSKGTA
ncbi:hypothetical protein [Puia dinghuensis]|uniref:Cache domain-containing protein n=1 Tax=Puia dinghuensis TaxID=1792502 RepID=A0A8J2UIU5_9BACT|nr:hypothetical protein [Puia dinghuensis]GGB23474.1 hypothetical protein GCM10011511_54170 [Puia dinghuensis]